MSQLRLYAVERALVETYVGPGPGRRRLRAEAERRWLTSRPHGFGLLGKLGPLTARPTLPVATAEELPGQADVDALLNGLPIPAERLRFAWKVVGGWLEHDAATWIALGVTAADIADLDAVAVRAGVTPDVTLQPLFATPPPLRLAPGPGMRVGWRAAVSVPSTATAYAGLPAAETSHTTLGTLSEWFATLLNPLDDEPLSLFAIETLDP